MEQEFTFKVEYNIGVDIHVAKEEFPDVWEDCDGEDDFIEFLRDNVLFLLEDLEELKYKQKLPPYITYVNIEEDV